MVASLFFEYLYQICLHTNQSWKEVCYRFNTTDCSKRVQRSAIEISPIWSNIQKNKTLYNFELGAATMVIVYLYEWANYSIPDITS